MAEDSSILKLISNSEDTENVSTDKSRDLGIKRRLSFSSEKHICIAEEPKTPPEVQAVSDDPNSSRVSPEIRKQRSPSPVNTHLKGKHAVKLKDDSSRQHCVNDTDDKENTAIPSAQNNKEEDNTSCQGGFKHIKVTASIQSDAEDRDAEVVRRAQEEGCVNVVFPGIVTQEGCCRFVSEILKCILYQRQQLPMTYDQLVYSQRKQQASVQDKDVVNRRPVHSADMDWRKCQQTLQELEEVLQQLEVLFSLSRVPQVLLLMGGSLVLPKELYEINMESLASSGGNQCLRVSSCLRQIFRTLFVADLLSDARPVRLMSTTVLVLAHRDCGVGWFRPKLQFKVPTRVKKQIIVLSSDPNVCKELRAEGSDWEDYVWFQAPVTIKGFSN
ncbi:MAD2L1-binding protein [Pelmatolapia mariae]|uniref:MAD2L1-binding protein n=1 Tax=Pelmatolapia mariae TaxID=158779 RepID=UPI002FE56E2F